MGANWHQQFKPPADTREKTVLYRATTSEPGMDRDSFPRERDGTGLHWRASRLRWSPPRILDWILQGLLVILMLLGMLLHLSFFVLIFLRPLDFILHGLGGSLGSILLSCGGERVKYRGIFVTSSLRLMSLPLLNVILISTSNLSFGLGLESWGVLLIGRQVCLEVSCPIQISSSQSEAVGTRIPLLEAKAVGQLWFCQICPKSGSSGLYVSARHNKHKFQGKYNFRCT
jgi:hypothetical protein